MSQTVMHGTKMLPQKQQSRRRYAANGFAFVPLRTVFLDGIVRAVETGQCRPTLPLLKEERAPSPTGEE